MQPNLLIMFTLVASSCRPTRTAAFSFCGNSVRVLSSSTRRSKQLTAPPAAAGAAAATKRPPRIYRRTALRVRERNGETLYRADRVLANRTGKSRKECFDLLAEKRVYIDDGSEDKYSFEVVGGPKTKLTMGTKLKIDRTHAVPLPPPLLCVYHKPKWELSVRKDPLGRPCIDHICLDMHPVGRLDYDTTGLLLFSSDGKLTQTLLHPKHDIVKEYRATVTGSVNETELRATLKAGVTTGEGLHEAVLVSVEHYPGDQVEPYLSQLRHELPKDYNVDDLQSRGYLDVFDAKELSTVTLTVSEGKHRMVRRMLANTGHPVVSLHRERLGEISLQDTPVGATRELSKLELKWARKQLQRQNKKQPRFLPDDDEDDSGSHEQSAE